MSASLRQIDARRRRTIALVVVLGLLTIAGWLAMQQFARAGTGSRIGKKLYPHMDTMPHIASRSTSWGRPRRSASGKGLRTDVILLTSNPEQLLNQEQHISIMIERSLGRDPFDTWGLRRPKMATLEAINSHILRALHAQFRLSQNDLSLIENALDKHSKILLTPHLERLREIVPSDEQLPRLKAPNTLLIHLSPRATMALINFEEIEGLEVDPLFLRQQYEDMKLRVLEGNWSAMDPPPEATELTLHFKKQTEAEARWTLLLHPDHWEKIWCSEGFGNEVDPELYIWFQEQNYLNGY